uniref:tRNA pseudouridine synthase Pus10 n=1 Tax=Mastacembelus armatus TaxID=205130 RepID=A0A7N8WW45_9TELE
MLPLKEKDKPVVQKLLSAGCCARCVLRFCSVSVQAAYRQAHKSHDAAAPESIGENSKSHDAAAPEPPEDPPCKRVRLESSVTDAAAAVTQEAEEPRVCVVCLGILQEMCSTTQAVKVLKHTFWTSLCVCVCVCVCVVTRTHTFALTPLSLREKGLLFDKDDVIQVKEAFKWVMQGLVAKQLGGVAVVTKSAFEVGVEFTHPETDADCHFLASACPDCFKPTKNKQSVFTRMAVVKALEKISDAKFLKHYPCPPTQPTSSCSPQDVQCLHTSVFVAGRYNKFSRSLPQTPWLIDGERRMESSVEELIAAPLLAAFRADGFNFSSSGREDVDVRTLGNDKIRVRDLQIVTREAMSRMKEGEEEKTKSYTALIWTQKPIQREDIIFIDDIKDLTLDQKTPLRVLHRRALAVRQRVIHSMNARFLDPHHFYLGLKTQAGTYIKEFVHGDFGRTKPNLCELLKTDADILELDVESVDVDWPPAIPE